jgi:hypothetical protein
VSSRRSAEPPVMASSSSVIRDCCAIMSVSCGGPDAPQSRAKS